MLLQIDPNKTVETMTKSTIELAEAAANYGALKLIFGFFILIVIIMFLAFLFQFFKLNIAINTLSKSSNLTLSYFNNLSNSTIGKEESKTIIRESFQKTSAIIKYQILRIRLENHIENTESTRRKIELIVHNDYQNRSNHFNRFCVVDKNLTTVIDHKDIESIIQLIIEQVYLKDEFTISNMDQSVELFFNGLKVEYQTKIDKL